MSFFKEFKIATEETCKAPWSAMKGGVLFYCAFCGRQFGVGDEYKAVYTNDLKGAGGNPLCCRSCYSTEEEMREVWKSRSLEWEELYKGKWRWFQDHCYRETHRRSEYEASR